MSEVSSTSPELFLLSSVEDFNHYSLKLIAQTRRTIAILSRDLDPLVYDNSEFINALSHFARSSSHAHVHILAKNTKHLVETGHKLGRLSQRLSSKIVLRKLTQEPTNTEMAFMLCDTSALLYKNDDSAYKGFANFNAAAEVKRLRETFDYLWQYGEPEAELQQFHI